MFGFSHLGQSFHIPVVFITYLCMDKFHIKTHAAELIMSFSQMNNSH